MIKNIKEMVYNDLKSDNLGQNVENAEENRKVRKKRIKMYLTKAEEKRLNKMAENDDKMSVLVMIIILVICFVLGISLGYMLYRIALNGGGIFS